MKWKFIVETHLGDFPTWATSAKKAIANVRFRLVGIGRGCDTSLWKVREA